MKIAFVGLGNMGGGMAANLVKAGHEVHAFDLAEAALAKAKENGATPYSDVRQAVVGVDAVVTMLPNGKIVENVVTSDVIGHAPAGALLIDCSTIDVATARRVTQAAEAAGYEMVDAPVSGGIAAASGGTLTFMVGGNMCCGVNKDELIVRLDPEREDEALSRPHARAMDFTGRHMPGFITIRPEGLDDDQLDGWVHEAVARAVLLPTK